MMEQSDGELVLACRKGDETAWESLVRRYQRLVYTIARRSGLDEESAAEVFQDVFTTLLDKLHQIEQPDRLKAWIVTTARRKTWHLIAPKRSFESIETGEDEADFASRQLADRSPLPDDVLVQIEEQHQVRLAMAALDQRCRQLLTLLFYQPDTAVSYSHIARELGIRVGSIGPTRARCLQKLARFLDSV